MFEKVCVLLVVNVRAAPVLSCTTRVPVSPVTATLIVYVALVTQVAVTVMLEVMVPLALLPKVQV